MSLQNLLTTGQLEEFATNAAQVKKSLDSSDRCINDARQESITPETRLEAGYRAIMQLSMVALWANGFRSSSSTPGHHAVMIQSLVHSVGLAPDDMRLLDTFRTKRNAINYTGDDVDIASVEACIDAADNLHTHVRGWLKNNKPELLT